MGDTLRGGFSVDDTFGNWSFSSSSSDFDSVDNITLFGFVSQSSGFVNSGGLGGSVDGGQLSVFPGSDTEDKSHNISLFFSPKFFQIFVGTHNILLIFYKSNQKSN